MTLVAKEFGVLPSVAARQMDRDPEGLDIMALGLLRYSEAHAAFRRANAKELKSWRNSKLMKLVERIEFEMVERGQ